MTDAAPVRGRGALAAGGVAVVVAAALLPFAGGGMDWSAVFGEPDSPDALIFFQTRIPRVLLAMLVGASLAVSGLVFQAVLRNPLAEPYILGVSVGASLGKFLAGLAGFAGWLGVAVISPLLCFAGALAPLLVLQRLALRRQRYSGAVLILAGVALNVMISALMLLLQYLTDFTQLQRLSLWLAGSLEIFGYAPLLPGVVLAAVCFLPLRGAASAMNILSLDRMTAAHLGLDVDRLVKRLLWAASILAAAAVSVSGPVGFVGLVVPHVLRLIVGPDHRVLLGLSALWGGVFLAVMDTIGRFGLGWIQAAGVPLLSTPQIPVGILTALLGGGFFLYLLFREQRARHWN